MLDQDSDTGCFTMFNCRGAQCLLGRVTVRFIICFLVAIWQCAGGGRHLWIQGCEVSAQEHPGQGPIHVLSLNATAVEDKTKFALARFLTLVATPCLTAQEPSAFSGVSRSGSTSASFTHMAVCRSGTASMDLGDIKYLLG